MWPWASHLYLWGHSTWCIEVPQQIASNSFIMNKGLSLSFPNCEMGMRHTLHVSEYHMQEAEQA